MVGWVMLRLGGVAISRWVGHSGVGYVKMRWVVFFGTHAAIRLFH